MQKRCSGEECLHYTDIAFGKTMLEKCSGISKLKNTKNQPVYSFKVPKEFHDMQMIITVKR